ncbi:MAG: M20 metallopeptidase family protein [Anaerolineae bacterium]
MEGLWQRAQALQETLREIRRRVHQHPELGFQEVETARLAAERLRDLGLEVREGVGRTGVVGTLGSGRPCIALRADMDALPIQEENEVPYASRRPGVMHACGHDAHVACLLGAAILLAQVPPAHGQVRFLFQPCEEGGDAEGKSGAVRMIEDGAMEGVDAVVGLHVTSELERGQVGFRAGPLMAAADRFVATVRGRAAHAAYPHRGVDAIVLAAQVILAIQTVVSRRLPPTDHGVITVGVIQGGVRSNVMADEVHLEGTIRSFTPEVRDLLAAGLRDACRIVEPLGGSYDLQVVEGFPVTLNDPELTALVRAAAVEVLGEGQVREIPPEMGSEDFSFLAQRARGCYFYLGTRTPGEPPRPAHSPTFDLDEEALPVGAAVLSAAALRFLSGGAKPALEP